MSEPMLLEALKLALVMAATYGSVKASLNGARADITEIKEDVKELGKTLTKHEVRIAILEERDP